MFFHSYNISKHSFPIRNTVKEGSRCCSRNSLSNSTKSLFDRVWNCITNVRLRKIAVSREVLSQYDSYNCGVFVCIHGVRLLKCESTKQEPQLSLNELQIYRNHMKKSLLSCYVLEHAPHSVPLPRIFENKFFTTTLELVNSNTISTPKTSRLPSFGYVSHDHDYITASNRPVKWKPRRKYVALSPTKVNVLNKIPVHSKAANFATSPFTPSTELKNK